MKRNRILRKTPAIRELVAETRLHKGMFLVPLFIIEGDGFHKEEITSMPGYYRGTLDYTAREVEGLLALGVSNVLLFVKVPDDRKTEDCVEAVREEGLLPTSVKFLKQRFPELCIMTDVALDPFSPHGHDGLVRHGEILNDETVAVLSRMSQVHAAAGADFVAPSDMMDGRVAAIRAALDAGGFTRTGIMSYSAKYASCFYGPFRDALDSAPGFGDKKTYQMDYRNRVEAIRETLTDIEEGADIVMVKPAGAYLDIIREVKDIVDVPVAAYQVSGEYAMIKAAAQRGWLNQDAAILESLTAIHRAGANIIATYFAKEAARLLRGK